MVTFKDFFPMNFIGKWPFPKILYKIVPLEHRSPITLSIPMHPKVLERDCTVYKTHTKVWQMKLKIKMFGGSYF